MATEAVKGSETTNRVELPMMETVAELEKQLNDNGVDTSEWGKGKAKSVEAFYNEVRDGESRLYLEGGKLMREVRSVAVAVYYDDPDKGRLKLVETRQSFYENADDARRDENEIKRNERTMTPETPTGEKMSLTEKIKAGEEKEVVITRALSEELGVENPEGTSFEFLREEAWKTDSQSYPNLTAKYVWECYAMQFGEQQYRPEGYIEVSNRRDGTVRNTYYEWIKA